ncbi:MAG: MutS-related protein [Cellulosilyticaceae bacterium]
MIIIFALLGIALIAIVYRMFHQYNQQSKVAYLKMKFGALPEVIHGSRNFKNIGTYYRLKKRKAGATDPRPVIDELTWDDLGMDEVFLRINQTESSIGESYLYDQLHRMHMEQETLDQFEALVQHMDVHEATRLKVQVTLQPLGKPFQNTIEKYLFNIEKKESHTNKLYSILGILPILALGVLVVDVSVGLMLLVVTIGINGYIHAKYGKDMLHEMTTIKSIYKMIKAANTLAKLEDETLSPYCEQLKASCQKLRYMMQFGTRCLLSTNSDLGILQDYAGIITLSQIRVHHKLITLFKEENEALRNVYETLGQLESSIAVASYRRTLDYWTVPEFGEEAALEVQKIYHPLIHNPVTNTATFTQDVLITGSNASGKSTFVKSLAISGILGQSIHTVLAKKYCAPMSYYMTSMAVSDSIADGESYYIAELRSLKRILDSVEKYPFCICFIDEILKGTNTIERIAASAAILGHLVEKKCLCFVASHDIELTRMLHKHYANYHFRETVGEEGISFDYKIHQGPSTTRNAIKLLGVMGYDTSIIDQSDELAQYFTEHQTWLEAK